VVDVQEIKAQMVRKKMTQKDVAKRMGMCTRTFNTRLRDRNFLLSEAEQLMQILEISDVHIFFNGELPDK
jgi:transcriptional regulator with XRE-family HTH domain